MSPKTKTQTAPKGGSKVTKKSGNAVKSSSAVAQDTKKDRDLNVKATRSLKKFPGFTFDQIHGIKVDGKTLWKTIIGIYEGGAKRIPPGRILKLRTAFQGQSGGFNVKPTADDEVRSQRLVKLIALSIVQDWSLRDRPAMYSYLALTSSMREGDFCAILNSVTGMSILAGGVDLQHCLEILKIIVVRQWHDRYKHIWETVKPFFLQCVVVFLGQEMLKQDAADFVAENRDILSWIIDVDKLDKLYMEGEGALAQDEKVKMMSDLRKDGCPVAEVLFGSELGVQTLETFKAKVKTFMVALEGDFTDAKIDETQVACFALSEEFSDKLGDDQEAWHCELEYDGMKLQIPCKDTFRHCELALSHVIRCKTQNLKDGPGLLLPQAWLGQKTTQERLTIKKSRIKDISAGRAKFNGLLKSSDKVEGVDILAWVALRIKQIEAKDRLWAIDRAMLEQLVHVKGPQVLKEKCLDLMPGEGKPVSLKACVDAIKALENTDLYKFVPEDLRGPIMSAMQVVSHMQRGKVTRAQFQAFSGFQRTIADRLIFFAKADGHHGSAGLKHWMQYVRTNPTASDLGDVVSNILLFRFALTATEEEEFEKTGRTCVIVSAGVKADTSTAKKSKKSASGNVSQMDLAIEAANNFF